MGGNGCKARPARFKNDVWTCDFIHDRTAEGRPLKWLSLVDEYTRECLVLHADGRLGGADVRRILGRVAGRRGAPNMIRSDNGSEFVCKALADWLPSIGTEPIPVAPGSPWQNGFVESFHGRLRDEFLERHVGGRRAGEGVVVPSGIRPRPAAQFARLRDAQRIRRQV